MEQEKSWHQKFAPLALHLVDDRFRSHPSKDVQLLIACCIAEVLRVYAPNSPFTEAQLVKEILFFLIEKLKGLKDTKSPNFDYCVYLLENLASVKSFLICSNSDDLQEVCFALFQLIFETVR